MASFVRTQEVEHAIGANGTFRLRTTSSDVELRSIDGDVARVRIAFEIRAPGEADADAAFEAAKFTVQTGTDRLEVAEPRRSSSGVAALASLFGVGSAHVASRIVAEVPRHANLAYEGVSADVTSVGFRGPQEYRTVSGDLVLNDLGGSIAVNGVSSDVSLRAHEPISLRANTVSGDLSIVAPRLDDARIVTVSGDIELEADLGHDRQHRVESVSGDLSLGIVGGLTLEVRGLSTDVSVGLPHRSEGSRDRRRYVIGDGATHLQFSSMSGDVVVHSARRIDAPTPPAPPAPPPSPAPPRAVPPVPVDPDEQLAILRALEAGEIDVDEATRRLAGGDRA